MTRRTRAVGFDLGETLYTYSGMPLSWSDHYGAALQAIADKCGFGMSSAMRSVGEAVLTAFNTRIHPRDREVTAAHVFSRLFLAWGLEPSTAAQGQAIETFFGHFRQHVAAYEESRATLAALRQSGVRVGAFTDVPYGMPRAYVEADLEETKLASAVEELVTSVDAGFRKPNPAGFQLLARRLGVAPSEMIFVGNEPKDIQGANSAGCRAVLICRQAAPRQQGQWKTISSLAELPKLLAD